MRPSFSLAILASRSAGLSQSAFDSFLPARARSSRGRCRDAALLGRPRQHLAIALATVAPYDAAQCRVRLHRRGVNTDPLTPDQSVLGQAVQHPAEHVIVQLQRQPQPCGTRIVTVFLAIFRRAFWSHFLTSSVRYGGLRNTILHSRSPSAELFVCSSVIMRSPQLRSGRNAPLLPQRGVVKDISMSIEK